MVRNTPLHQFNILDLPLELVGEILRNVDGKHLLRCALVCRSLRDMIASTVELRYKIELFADGLEDGDPCGLSSAERLALLRDRRRAWRTLDYTRRSTVSVAGRCNAYELVGGVFAKTMDTTAHGGGSRHLSTSYLPTRQDEAKETVTEDIGLPTRDFAIDPTQDLIAFVESPKLTGTGQSSPPEVRIHFHTLSTNKPHPDAAQTVLTHNTSFPVENAFVQVADDVVGFFFWGEGPGLVIWNWKTGKVMVNHISTLQDRDAWDFSFLSPRCYMMANLSENGSLDIFSFGDASSASTNGTPSRVVSLGLPPVRVGTALVNMSAHSAPFTGRAPRGKPFSTSPDARIHAISIQYFQEGDASHRRFCLFVHNRSLLKFVQEWEDGASRAKQPWSNLRAPCVPWDSWGPDATRVMPHHAPFQWLRYVHGQRVVMPPMNIQDGPEVEQLIRVLDFSAHPARRAPELDAGDAPGRATKLFTETTEDVDGHVFRRPVVSRLPCLILERQDIAYRYSGFMIDEERLIGLKSSAFSSGDMGDLDVFTF